MPVVVKKDGRREPFERAKLFAGITKACEKRPIPLSTIEEMVRRVEKTVFAQGEKEVATQTIGKHVMQVLQEVDEVAYVRFASVYRSFKDINGFPSRKSTTSWRKTLAETCLSGDNGVHP